MTDKPEVQTDKEQTSPRKPDGVLTTKMEGKTFITEIYFDHDSKETFQDKMLKVIRSERKE
jgi:hypothetical protein